MPKLTPAQKRTFLAIAKYWGDVFTLPYNYFWMSDKQLVRAATKQEQETYRDNLRSDIIATHERLVMAAQSAHYDKCIELAQHASYITRELNAWIEERERLFAINETGKTLAARLQEVK